MKSVTGKSFFIAASPLFLALFIDGMGLGLLFPILNAILIQPSGGFLPVNVSPDMRNFLYGLTCAIFMFCWFFGAAYLGDLSDHIGRKKSLMICLIGACIGYFLSAIAVITSSLLLLLLGRVVAGFTAGSQSIAQAAIVDLSTEAEKPRNIGFILLAISLGFIVGPILGGVLSDSHLMAWFSFSTPLYFAAIISLLNVLLLWKLFRETFAKKGKFKLKLHHAIEIFISAFKDHRVRNLSVVLLILVLGWSNYYTFISLFLLKKYHVSVVAIALFLGCLGVGFGIGCGLLPDRLSKRFPLKNIVAWGCAITAVCVLVTLITNDVIYAWLAVIPLGTAIAVAYSVILTIFSNQVDADSQGWVMGITGSIMAFCFGFTAIISSLLANVNIHLPLIISVLGLAGAAWLIALYKAKRST